MTDNLELFWIDEISKIWETIKVPGIQKSLRSYRVVKKAEFPEEISEFPSVLTYTLGITDLDYSLGGSVRLVWSGISEFHLFEGTSKKHIPSIMKYPKRIIEAAATTLTLNETVSSFVLQQRNGLFVQGPVSLKYGDEAENLGLVVGWKVIEDVTGLISVSE